LTVGFFVCKRAVFSLRRQAKLPAYRFASAWMERERKEKFSFGFFAPCGIWVILCIEERDKKLSWLREVGSSK